ncbi:MAG: hypothetical protein Q8P26_04355 [Candidatus Levybacteria bacterium]|nr:hypothetical protein [Candidatus Levybacteria bacterium]
MILRFHFLALIFIAILAIFTYWDLPNTFFLQDEWEVLASINYYQSKGWIGIIQSSFPPTALSHFNPLGLVYVWLTHLLFYTNFEPYAYLSITLRIINTFLLYYFILSWLKKRKIAFFAALFFAINSISHQAVTWVATVDSYAIPTAFILLSLIFFQRFLVRDKHWKRNMLFSMLMLLASLLHHENGIFLFLFYPVVFFLFAKSKWKKLLPTFSYGILISIFVFIAIRIPFFFGLTVSVPDIANFSHSPIAVYPYRLISIGMKSFAESLIPEKTLIDISEQVVRLAYPQFLSPDKTPNPFIAQSIVFDLVSYVLTVFIICVFILLIGVMREKKILQAFIWALIFVPVSFSPYIFVLGRAGYASIIEPKFFYIGSIGVSILVAITVYSALSRFSRQKTLKLIIYLLFGLYLLSHVYAIKMHLGDLEKTSIQRKTFLTKVQLSYPNLSQKVVFFTQSDTAYYGMPENEKILPVQIGFGRILMVWYQKDERFPGCLYEGRFLLNLLEEGYRFCEGRGFGYFRNYDKLVAAVLANDIKSEEIIGYSWERQREEFIDITEKVRGKIKQDIERNK